MSFKIVADSGCDIFSVDGLDFESVALKLSSDEREFTDDIDLDIKEMADYFKSYKGRSGSSCPNPTDWEYAFDEAQYVFALAVTSTLSGSYNAAVSAKLNYESIYADRRVFTIDSLSAGPEMLLLIYKLRDLILAGLDFDTICTEITEYQKHMESLFVFESLTNLANNGRVNKAVAKLCGVLGVRIVATASLEGTIESIHKCRGEVKVLPALIQEMKQRNYQGGKIYLNHCSNERFARRIAAEIKTNFGDVEIIIGETRGLCTFYCEQGGIMMGFEVD